MTAKETTSRKRASRAKEGVKNVQAKAMEPLTPIGEPGGALMPPPGIEALAQAGGEMAPAVGAGLLVDLKDVHQVVVKAADMTGVELDVIKPRNMMIVGPGGVKDGRGAVVLRLPVAEVDGGYCSRHVEVGRLTPRQALARRMLRDGLYRSGARLPIPNTNEVRPVASNADVIRWILDSAGECCAPD